MIQRPWDGTFDEYLTYTQREQNPNRQYSAADLKYTDGGRKVFSGGGIEPDRRFDGPIEGFNPSRFGRTLAARLMFANFAQRFDREGDNPFGGASDATARRIVSAISWSTTRSSRNSRRICARSQPCWTRRRSTPTSSSSAR